MRPLLLLLIVLVSLTSAAIASELPVDKVKLLELLRDGNFEGLEARLTRLQQDSEAGGGQDLWVGVAFHVFSVDDSQVQERLEEWVAGHPGSYAPRVARSMNQWNLGWDSRGGAYARETSDEQFSSMRAHFAKAREDLDVALEINERLGIAYALLISIARTGEGLETLEVGLDAVPRSFHMRWMFLGNLQPQWGGSIEMMEAFAEAAVSSYPEDPILQTLRGYPDWYRGKRLKRKGKNDEALILFDRALGHGPNWRYVLSRGETLERLGRGDEALEAYNLANSLRPQEIDVLRPRGWLRFKAGRLVEALEDYTLALSLDPMDPGNLTSRAMVLRNLKRNDLALADLDQALIRGSDSARVRATRGHLLLNQLQDPEAAQLDLKRATELAPKNTNHWYNYGQALYTLRDCQLVPAFQEFVELCDVSGKCSEGSLSWVRTTLKFVDDQGFCPK